MSRRVRHVHANDDEWVVVHRDPPSNDGGCGCIIAIVILIALLGGC